MTSNIGPFPDTSVYTVNLVYNRATGIFKTPKYMAEGTKFIRKYLRINYIICKHKTFT